MKLAITGGTGFVGSHLLDVALSAGHQLAALTRREQPARDGLEWVTGDLQDRSALERLVDGADAIVHVAGTINRGYGTAAMYDVGKILVAGGGQTPPVDSAEVIDLNQPSPAWHTTGSMIHARHHAIGTVLPDGTVLVTGGTSSPGLNDPAGAVMEPEVWDPATGRWTALARMAVKRLYHSTALLLPDARVFVGGGGQPSAEGEPDHFDAQIYSPPYLFKADGSAAARPQIDDAPTDIAYGETFIVSTATPAAVAQVTLLRLGSMTHAFDQGQRLAKLPFADGPNGLKVTAPANANLAPPGHYMLFLVGTSGVPSVARIVHVG